MSGKSKNLLRNPCAKDGLDYWEVACSGGDGFRCEKEPEGCKTICDCSNVKGNLPCWSTSHDPCEKFQLVYLPEHGIKAEKLDEKKPDIRVRDWYSPRNDCGCEYKITVRLLADDKSTELDSWSFTDTKNEGSDWTKVKHVFKNYPSGVRYVEFRHGGKDTKNWAGHYGVKITNSGVFVGKKKSNKKKRDVRAKSGKNLLKNPCGKSGMEGWEVVKSGGEGFKCEEEAEGVMPVKELNKDAEEKCCWSTSFGDCEKKQLIDLGFNGFDADMMDEVRPEIKFSEWFGSRSDAGCEYWLKVRLLNSDLEEIDHKEIKESKGSEGSWYHVEGSFTDYKPGVRFIEYSHGGRDNCNWAGHYGAKIACSYVAVMAESQSSSSSSSSSDDD